MTKDRAKVTIEDQTGSKRYTVILPTNVSTRQVLPILAKQLALPTESSGGAPIQYFLALEAGEGLMRLEEDETLAEAGVQDGTVLRIEPKMAAGGPFTSDMKSEETIAILMIVILKKLKKLGERIEAIENRLEEVVRAVDIISRTSDEQAQSESSIDDDGMDKAKVAIVDQTSGKRHTVILPTNALTRQVLSTLAKQLALPTESPGGAPTRYFLALEAGEGRIRLEEDETLAEAGVQDGTVLIITPEMTAGCFLAGTMVSLPDGTQAAINKLRAGDEVLSHDTETGTLCSGTIAKVIEDFVESYLVINRTLRITETHLVYSNGEWVRAGDLKCGDHLQAVKGNKAIIESLERKRQRTKVYNLCMASDTHTFFAEGILVHNHQSKPIAGEVIDDILADFISMEEAVEIIGALTEQLSLRKVSTEKFIHAFYQRTEDEQIRSKQVRGDLVEAFAVAQIEDYSAVSPLAVDKAYKLLAGILCNMPAAFIGVPVQLPDTDVVEIDIVVHAAGVEVLPHWNQKVRFFPGRDSGLLEFTLIPREAGQKQIRVEFYYQRHWLAQIQFAVEVIEAQELVPA